MKQGTRMALVLLSLTFLLRVAGTAAEEQTEVLATVGEQTITFQDFARLYSGLVPWLGTTVKADEVQKDLEQIIWGLVLLHEARQSGLANRPEIQARIDEFVAREYLNSRLPAPEQMVVEEGESKSYYEQHRERFRVPPKVKMAHILVASEAEAQAVRQAVQVPDPQAFGRLARERSLDPASAQQGGDLGWVVATQLVPGLAEAAQDLEPGQVSGVIKTTFGSHLVKLQEKPPLTYQPYADVQEQIGQAIVVEKRAALLRDLQQELWTKYHVVVHQDVLQAVLQRAKDNSPPWQPQRPGTQVEQPQRPGTQVEQPQRPGTQAERPRLQLLSTAYNVGTIAAETITHTSLVTNSGDAELIINRVHTTCRCAKATISPERLLPGQTGKLTVVYNPDYYKEDGSVTKTIYLESNDPEHSRQAVQLTAEIVRGQVANEQR